MIAVPAPVRRSWTRYAPLPVPIAGRPLGIDRHSAAATRRTGRSPAPDRLRTRSRRERRREGRAAAPGRGACAGSLTCGCAGRGAVARHRDDAGRQRRQAGRRAQQVDPGGQMCRTGPNRPAPRRWFGVHDARTSISADGGRSAISPKLCDATRVTVPLAAVWSRRARRAPRPATSIRPREAADRRRSRVRARLGRSSPAGRSPPTLVPGGVVQQDEPPGGEHGSGLVDDIRRQRMRIWREALWARRGVENYLGPYPIGS